MRLRKRPNVIGLDGICVMTSKGGWLADKSLFEKNGFEQIAAKDRFELLVKTWNHGAVQPRFHNWTNRQKDYQGWHLRYADQCPWNEKSVAAILNVAMDYGVRLKSFKNKHYKGGENGAFRIWSF